MRFLVDSWASDNACMKQFALSRVPCVNDFSLLVSFGSLGALKDVLPHVLRDLICIAESMRTSSFFVDFFKGSLNSMSSGFDLLISSQLQGIVERRLLHRPVLFFFVFSKSS